MSASAAVDAQQDRRQQNPRAACSTARAGCDDPSCRGPARRGTTGPPRGPRGGASAATPGAAGRRAAPSCGRTRRCRTAGPVRARAPPSRARSSGLVDQPHDARRPAPRASRLGTITASCSSVRTSSRPSASVATIGLPHRQRLEHRQRRAFPQRRKHAEVERRDDARRRRARSRRRRTDRRGRAPRLLLERRRAAAPRRRRRTAPAAARSSTSRAASTRYELPFESCSRVTVPIANSSGAMPSSRRAAAISSADRGRLNSSSGTPR